MKRLSWTVVFAALLYTLATAARGQAPQEGNDPEIVATGTGLIEADPDRARIDITVQGFGKTLDEAADICALNYMRLLDTLRDGGVGSDRLMTRRFDTYPEQGGKRRRETIGHWVIHELYIETSDVNEIPDIASRALYSEVASARVMWVLSSRADSVRSVALAEATLSAMAEAQEMAASAGGVLGELIELTNHYPEDPRFPSCETDAQAIALKGGIVMQSSIKPRRVEVRASVRGRWKLIGGFGN